MVTPEEIDRLEIFAAPAPERERLARVAVDIWLTPGDYAAHGGDERALYAVTCGLPCSGNARVLGFAPSDSHALVAVRRFLDLRLGNGRASVWKPGRVGTGG